MKIVGRTRWSLHLLGSKRNILEAMWGKKGTEKTWNKRNWNSLEKKKDLKFTLLFLPGSSPYTKDWCGPCWRYNVTWHVLKTSIAKLFLNRKTTKNPHYFPIKTEKNIGKLKFIGINDNSWVQHIKKQIKVQSTPVFRRNGGLAKPGWRESPWWSLARHLVVGSLGCLDWLKTI